MLGHIAARNRIGRLRLGVGVTDTGRRNPAVTAQAAATLHLLTRGRAILGIGPGEREGNEPYGVDWSKPVARFEEAMATIRALWDSAANSSTGTRPTSRCGTHCSIYRLSRKVARDLDRSPRSAHAARRGALRGAYFPMFSHRPVDYKQRLDVVRSAASDAGRDPMSIIPAMGLFVVTGRTRDAVDEALDSEVLRVMGLNASDEVFARHGARHPLGAGFSGAQDLLPHDMDEQTALSHVADIPSSLVREILLNGTPDQVIEQAAQWRDCGVRYTVLANASFMQRSLRKGLTSVQPFNKIVRGLKRL